MQPDPTHLMNKIELEIPLVGLYDAPDAKPFEPLIRPGLGRPACVFGYYKHWLAGKTLHLTREHFGCGGAGTWLFGVQNRSRESFCSFLVEDEGLKASRDLMDQWLDHNAGYRPKHTHFLIGPLCKDQYQHLKTVTFFVNPDQLSVLTIGAQYRSASGDPPPVIAPFGSGCMQLLSLFEDLDLAQALIGATDIAMRRHLEPELLAFTVTLPMFELLCDLDRDSFLCKRFWKDLRKARK